MVQRITKTIEFVFVIIVIILFCIVANKYYGHAVKKYGHTAYVSYLNMRSQIREKTKEADMRAKYINMAKGISVAKQIESSTGTIPVLVYHGIVENDPKNDEEISLKNFEEQMYELKREGYQTVTTDDFYQFINNGKKLPDKSFILTFDDGRKDSYYSAEPILEALDYKAVIFIITNTFYLKKPSTYYLSVDELKKMIASGHWEIQSHGKNDHGYIQIDSEGSRGRFMSNKKWLINEQRLETDDEYKERISNDLLDSKTDLKNFLGVDASAYALPAGDYGHKLSNYPDAENAIQSILSSSFSMTFYQFNPDSRLGYYRSNYQASGLGQFFFRRIKVTSDFDATGLINILKASEEKNFPFKDDFSNQENWVRGWGSLQYNENGLNIRNDEGSNSAAIYLDGSTFWKNYSYNVDVKLEEGTGYSMLARVKNGVNFVGCSFEVGTIRAFSVNNGVTNILYQEKMERFSTKQQYSLGVGVYDNTIMCLMNKKIILKKDLDAGHEIGGIGLNVFTRNKGGSAVLNILTGISASSL